jgi:amino-acid N-acetyltransferase
MFTIEAGAAGDHPAVAALLTEAGLPLAGLAETREVLVARDGGRLVGCAAIEVYDDGGLLRSVAVAPAERGTGLGRALVDAAVARATALRLPALFLLTMSAERFFPQFGFEIVDRAVVPPGVRCSVQFTSVCPSTAIVMRRALPLGELGG